MIGRSLPVRATVCLSVCQGCAVRQQSPPPLLACKLRRALVGLLETGRARRAGRTGHPALSARLLFVALSCLMSPAASAGAAKKRTFASERANCARSDGP